MYKAIISDINGRLESNVCLDPKEVYYVGFKSLRRWANRLHGKFVFCYFPELNINMCGIKTDLAFIWILVRIS